MKPALIVLAALLPVGILLPCQFLIVLKSPKSWLKLMPGLLTVLGILICFIFLKQGIYRILLVLYGVLLLILCGVSWILALSIEKSHRK